MQVGCGECNPARIQPSKLSRSAAPSRHRQARARGAMPYSVSNEHLFSAFVLGSFTVHQVRRLLKMKALPTEASLDEAREFVGSTANAVAAMRAYESRQPDALFKDELAEVLAGDLLGEEVASFKSATSGAALQDGELARFRGRELPDGSRSIGMMTIRTLFIDRTILAALEPTRAPPITQVVLLGAGMDTRAWRLELPPGVAWFEVDRAEVLASKRTLLGAAGAGFTAAPGAQHPLRAASYQSVGADLREDWPQALAKAGFDPGRGTMWVLEGLLNYLDPPTAGRALSEAARVSGSGSRLFATCVNWSYIQASRAGEVEGDVARAVSRVQHFGLPDTPEEARPFFTGNGWAPERMAYGESTARELVGPTRVLEFPTEPPAAPGLRYLFTTAALQAGGA